MWPLVVMIVGAVAAAFALAILVRHKVNQERRAP
jgi:hypothetical protein